MSVILIVDDQPSSRATVESILDGQGYQLEFAEDGKTALQMAYSLQPDLILMDVMMPGMDGFEACRRIRSDPRIAEVPIIIVTALDDRSSLLLGIEAGADDYLYKPINRQELRARVRTVTRLNRYRTLSAQREELRAAAGRMAAALEEERQRLSRELHDDLGQALTAHLLGLRELESGLPARDAALKQRLEVLIRETVETVTKMRQLAQDLRPPVLDTLGLRAAIENYCKDFSQRARLPVTFDAEQELPALPDVQAITLYRFLQEALTNVVKHAQASQVWVEVDVDETSIVLTVQDNGRGFSEREGAPGGIGLSGMRERLAIVGGSLRIESGEKRGAILSASLPLEPRPAGSAA